MLRRAFSFAEEPISRVAPFTSCVSGPLLSGPPSAFFTKSGSSGFVSYLLFFGSINNSYDVVA
jgi:hypothetical protein